MASALQKRTRALAFLYGVTAVAAMILARCDVKDIYRFDVYIAKWLGPPGAWYSGADLVRYSFILIAPGAVLLFNNFGLFVSSASRIRTFFLTLGFALPVILITCIPHPHGGRAALYVGGPTASILAAVAYRKISYEKCAFWSSVTVLLSRIFVLRWELPRYTPTVGSYVLWGQLEFSAATLSLLCAVLSAIRLVYFARAEHHARKTFTA